MAQRQLFAHSSPKAWSLQLRSRSGSYRNSNVSITREEKNTLEARYGGQQIQYHRTDSFSG